MRITQATSGRAVIVVPFGRVPVFALLSAIQVEGLSRRCLHGSGRRCGGRTEQERKCEEPCMRAPSSRMGGHECTDRRSLSSSRDLSASPRSAATAASCAADRAICSRIRPGFASSTTRGSRSTRRTLGSATSTSSSSRMRTTITSAAGAIAAARGGARDGSHQRELERGQHRGREKRGGHYRERGGDGPQREDPGDPGGATPVCPSSGFDDETTVPLSSACTASLGVSGSRHVGGPARVAPSASRPSKPMHPNNIPAALVDAPGVAPGQRRTRDWRSALSCGSPRA